MLIRITPEDIAQSARGIALFHPVAFALRRTYGLFILRHDEVFIVGTAVLFRGVLTALPETLGPWLRAYRLGVNVGETEFEFELPGRSAAAGALLAA